MVRVRLDDAVAQQPLDGAVGGRDEGAVGLALDGEPRLVCAVVADRDGVGGVGEREREAQ